MVTLFPANRVVPPVPLLPYGIPGLVGAVIGGAVLLGVFVLVERRVAESMLDFALLRNRTFAGGNLASLLAATAAFVLLGVLPMDF